MNPYHQEPRNNFAVHFNANFTSHEKSLLSTYLECMDDKSLTGPHALLKNMIYKSCFEPAYKKEFKDWLYAKNGSSTVELRELARKIGSESNGLLSSNPMNQKDLFESWVGVDAFYANIGTAIDFSIGFRKDSGDKYAAIYSAFDTLPKNDETKEAKRVLSFFASQTSVYPSIKVGLEDLLSSGSAKPFIASIVKTFKVDVVEAQEMDFVTQHIQDAIDATGLFRADHSTTADGPLSFTEHEQHVIDNIKLYIDTNKYAVNSLPLLERVVLKATNDERFHQEFKGWLYGTDGASTTVIRELAHEVWEETNPFSKEPPAPTNFNNAWMTLDTAKHIYEVIYNELADIIKALPVDGDTDEVYRAFSVYTGRCQQFPDLKSNLHCLLYEGDANQFSEALLKAFYVEEYLREDFTKMIDVVASMLVEMNDEYNFAPAFN
jgi:hypothetical protein